MDVRGTKRPFSYLVVTHVPFGRCPERPDRFLVGDMWRQDLLEQNKAIRQVGGRLAVAAPLYVDLKVKDSGSFNLAPLEPAAEDLAYFPLTPYLSFRRFAASLPRLISELRGALRGAAIVQADYGGHPISLGQVVWPLAGRAGARRIWVFDGADPFPRLEMGVSQTRNSMKRWAMAVALKQFKAFCHRVFETADLVYVHNDAVARRFAAVWNNRSYLLPRTFVTEAVLVDEAELERRRQQLLDAAHPLRLVVAGRQIAIKATDHVLRAMAVARSRGTDFFLTVIGEGEEVGDFQRLAVDLGLSDRVVFLGQIPYGDQLFARWAEADAMVITNLTAEISRNVFLGMSRGLPLIMYRNPGTDRLIEDNQAGLLVPPGDIGALAAAFHRVHQDRGILSGFAVRGLDLARHHTLAQCHRTRAELASACLASGGPKPAL